MSMFFCEHHGRLEDSDYTGIEIYNGGEVCTVAHVSLLEEEEDRVEAQRQTLLNLLCARRGPALASVARELAVLDNTRSLRS